MKPWSYLTHSPDEGATAGSDFVFVYISRVCVFVCVRACVRACVRGFPQRAAWRAPESRIIAIVKMPLFPGACARICIPK